MCGTTCTHIHRHHYCLRPSCTAEHVLLKLMSSSERAHTALQGLQVLLTSSTTPGTGEGEVCLALRTSQHCVCDQQHQQSLMRISGRCGLPKHFVWCMWEGENRGPHVQEQGATCENRAIRWNRATCEGTGSHVNCHHMQVPSYNGACMYLGKAQGTTTYHTA